MVDGEVGVLDASASGGRLDVCYGNGATRPDDPCGRDAEPRDQFDCAYQGVGSWDRPAALWRGGQVVQRCDDSAGVVGGMADVDVPPKHGIAYRSVAMGSAGNLERPGREGLLHRECHAGRGNDPAFRWVSATPPGRYPGRWDGQRWILATDGWRCGIVLEEQSVPGAGVYRGGRCV